MASTLQQQNLNEAEIMQQLHQAYEQQIQNRNENIDWRSVSSAELIDHIIAVHHAYLQQELPLLSEYVTKILRVHGPRHGDTLAHLHKLFHTLKMDMEQHLIKEEEMIFPVIKTYERDPSESARLQTAQAIAELEQEHQAAGDILKAMRQITDDYKLPEDACRTYILTFQKLEQLESNRTGACHDPKLRSKQPPGQMGLVAVLGLIICGSHR